MRVPLHLRVLPSAAFRAWFTPPPLPDRVATADAAATRDIERFEVFTERGPVGGLVVGEGPTVLALHGWGGRAAQMAPVARRLAADGFRVLMPDMPGRAGSEFTDIREFVTTANAFIGVTGQPFGIVAHSLAAMSMRLLYAEASPPVAMVAPALSVADSLATFALRLRMTSWASDGLRRRLEAWDPGVFEKLDGLHPSQLGDTPVLVLHDPHDRQAPFSSAAAFAALRPRTTLVPIEGGGHNGLLAQPGASDAISEFFASVGSAAIRGDGLASPPGGD